MKLVYPTTAAMLVALLMGCAVSSPRGGGMNYSEGFNIVVPTAEVNLPQGATETTNITLLRGDNFKQDVKLQPRADKGITADPSSLTVKASNQPEAQIRLSAARDAALGDYRVTVTGKPESGEPTSTEFRVKVVAPDLKRLGGN